MLTNQALVVKGLVGQREMASILGVSSIYQTPCLELYRRVAASSTTAQSIPSSCSFAFPDRSHFNSFLRAYNNCNNKSGSRHGHGLVPSSAIATPNSVLSEEAFKGLGDFSKDSLDVSDDDDDYDSEAEPSSSADDDELAVSKLGLPRRLVDSLQQRGITHLFPIQVCVLPLFLLLLSFCYFSSC